MSATIGDDSALIRTFDAAADSVGKPIMSKSLAGVSERMILAPELMNLTTPAAEVVPKIATWMVEKKKAGTVILVPSGPAAEPWKALAELPEKTKDVAEAVRKLQAGESRGPYVFANRYDGIDLPGDTCRLLIVSGLPKGMGEYDLYRANVFAGGSAINSELAQRIEQGIGRGARGSNDYCVVLITGKDLIGWISKTANLRFLTSGTRAQLEMGAEICRSVTGGKELAETMEQCLTRDRDWTQYHAETLADTVEHSIFDQIGLDQAALERRAFNWVRDGHYEKAIAKLRAYCDQQVALDKKTKGWLLQMAAAAATHWDQAEMALALQQQAYAANRNLPRPKVVAPYEPLFLPGPQSQAIVEYLKQFKNRRGCLADFDELVSHLVREASSNQFEQAMAELAGVLGFVGERPEQSDPKGPDVLWLLDDKLALVIEAKIRKKPGNSLTREQHGQLLHAAEWFQSKYPKMKCIRASVHPNSIVSRSTVSGETKAFTFENLQRLTTDVRVLLDELCQCQDDSQLVLRCEKLLAKSKLSPKALSGEYLISFEE